MSSVQGSLLPLDGTLLATGKQVIILQIKFIFGPMGGKLVANTFVRGGLAKLSHCTKSSFEI